VLRRRLVHLLLLQLLMVRLLRLLLPLAAADHADLADPGGWAACRDVLRPAAASPSPAMQMLSDTLNHTTKTSARSALQHQRSWKMLGQHKPH
jgi:hypothetical protein